MCLLCGRNGLFECGSGSVALGRGFLRLIRLYLSTSLYQYPAVIFIKCCSYHKDKWAKPGNLPKSNYLFEKGDHWTEKYFQLFFKLSKKSKRELRSLQQGAFSFPCYNFRILAANNWTYDLKKTNLNEFKLSFLYSINK